MPDDGRGYSPLFPLSQRQPPSNLQAEQALLGAILRNNKAFDQVGEFLEPEHFADPVNGRIYAECRRLIAGGRLADAVTLRSVFEGAGILDEVGGTAYLAELLTAMVSIINAGEYGRAVHDAWIRRQAIDLGQQLVETSFGADPALDGQTIITQAVGELLALGEQRVRGVGASLGSAAARAIAQAEAAYRGDSTAQPLSCGIAALDDMWGGLWPGEQYYVAARSRTGKTPFMMQVCRHVAAQFRARGQGEHVQVFSLEMPAEGLANGSLAALTGIAADDIRCGKLQGERNVALLEAQRQLDALPILVEDEAGMTLNQIVMRARASARAKKVRLVAIDHRDLIGRDREHVRLPLMEWLPLVTRRTKQLAKAIDAPVVLLCQLNRDVEKREDTRPKLSDIPYSGEQDADAVLALHRPELYLGEAPPRFTGNAERRAVALAEWNNQKAEADGLLEASFLKRRFGPTGWARLHFDKVRMLVTEPPAIRSPDLLDEIPPAMSEAEYGE